MVENKRVLSQVVSVVKEFKRIEKVVKRKRLHVQLSVLSVENQKKRNLIFFVPRSAVT